MPQQWKYSKTDEGERCRTHRVTGEYQELRSGEWTHIDLVPVEWFVKAIARAFRNQPMTFTRPYDESFKRR